MNRAELALAPKNELLEIIERKELAQKREKVHNEKMLEKGLGHVVAMGGGALGAVIKRYVPGLIPGEGAGDTAVVFGINALIDGAAVMMRGDLATQLNYFGAGMDGYLVGSAVESILP